MIMFIYFDRTDCLQYRKYENGKYTGLLPSLKEYSEQLKDMVTFYLGCSFTFEKMLQKAGVPIRNVEQKCNVSMYKVRAEASKYIFARVKSKSIDTKILYIASRK